MNGSSDDELLRLSTEFPAAADYLSTILLIDRDYGEVHNTRLADRLGVSKPAVSQAISRLKNKGLVKQDNYKTIELTVSGRVLAEKIIRRHYLIEHLLIRAIDYPWERADDEALRLQTVISGDLADHMYEAFGKPQACPHGNPFPGAPNEREIVGAARLIDCSIGAGLRVLRITEEGEAVDGLLPFCQKHQLRPGVSMVVKSVDNSHEIVIQSGGRVCTVPWEFARHIAIADDPQVTATVS